LKIVTWNVNGLRSVLRKKALDWLCIEDADVVCLQEIKAKPEQIPKESINCIGDYYSYWNSAIRPGYSGVLTFCKQALDQVQYGFGIQQFDKEGRLIVSNHSGIWLLNTYFPNGKRDHTRLTYKYEFYAQVLEYCQDLHEKNKNVIITGDFNTAHDEIDLRYPKQNQKTSGFLPEERAWIDKLLNSGFIDAYRNLYPDRIQYTWWTYRLNARERNIGWRLDYFLISRSLLSAVKDVQIRDDVIGSDHCPVILSLDKNSLI